MDQEILDNLGVTDYMICNFDEPGDARPVGVYVGYHERQIRDEGGGAAASRSTRPSTASRARGWDVIEPKTVPSTFPDSPARPR